MRKPSNDGLWRQFVSKPAVGAACAVLGVSLGLQVLLQEREAIAASAPATRPVLAGLCGMLGCTLGAFRQIEALQIDSSAFARVSADTYRLSFVLRNTAAVSVAVPAVELTLTDTQEQPVVRRVLQAQDFAHTQTAINANGEINVSMPLAVEDSVGKNKFSGYRLLVFYP